MQLNSCKPLRRKWRIKTLDKYKFYFKMRKVTRQKYTDGVILSGGAQHLTSNGLLRPLTPYCINQSLVDGFHAFLLYDAEGKIVPTRHRRIFNGLCHGMKMLNMMTEMYARECFPPINNIGQGSYHFKEINEDLKKNGWPLWARRAISTSFKKYKLKELGYISCSKFTQEYSNKFEKQKSIISKSGDNWYFLHSTWNNS